MDPTVAALIGAALGAIATATVPLMTTRARKREVADERRRSDTVALLDVMIRLLKARRLDEWRRFTETHSEAVVALQRLLINADSRDAKHLQMMGNFALESISNEENVALAEVGVEAMSEVLSRWCRRELKGNAIANAYEPAMQVQFEKHGARWRDSAQR